VCVLCVCMSVCSVCVARVLCCVLCMCSVCVCVYVCCMCAVCVVCVCVFVSACVLRVSMLFVWPTYTEDYLTNT